MNENSLGSCSFSLNQRGDLTIRYTASLGPFGRACIMYAKLQTHPPIVRYTMARLITTSFSIQFRPPTAQEFYLTTRFPLSSNKITSGIYYVPLLVVTMTWETKDKKCKPFPTPTMRTRLWLRSHRLIWQLAEVWLFSYGNNPSASYNLPIAT